MPAFLLSLTLLLLCPWPTAAHAPRPIPPREAFVCEAVLRLANPQATWEDPSLLTTIRYLQRVHVPALDDVAARELKSALDELVHDVTKLPAGAFPVKQVSIGREQIQDFLDKVSTMASRCEDGYRPERARRPFSTHPRYVTEALAGLSGVGASGMALALGSSFVNHGYSVWGILSAIAGAGCAHGVATPSLKGLWWDILNADLLSSADHRARPQTTTATFRAHAFEYFTSQVLLGLQSGSPRRFAWGRLRVKLPLSASTRPAQAGSPRAPTGHEVGAAIRDSGEFWFPYDARVVHIDLFFYHDADQRQPVLLTFVRER